MNKTIKNGTGMQNYLLCKRARASVGSCRPLFLQVSEAPVTKLQQPVAEQPRCAVLKVLIMRTKHSIEIHQT
eukprot:1866328-Amphidinium_carterae.1